MRNEKKVKLLLKKVSGSTTAYSKLDSEDKELKKVVPPATESAKKCEFKPAAESADAKAGKKKRKGWKRFRHALLVSCRYIGIGVSHMSPVASYPTTNYTMDPYGWSCPFNSKVTKAQPAHWTTGIILNGW